MIHPISSHVPISDNQEIFSEVTNDTQLMVDILERAEKAELEAIAYHFEDLSD